MINLYKTLLYSAALTTCCFAETAYAQEPTLIGQSRERLENGFLTSYEFSVKKELVNDHTTYLYLNKGQGDFRSKNIFFEFDENGICVKVVNSCIYNDLKEMTEYLDKYYKKIAPNIWHTVDGQFQFNMLITSTNDQVLIITSGKPK